MTQLPPKRYQDYHDTVYDSIRHNPWFRILEARREKIKMLEMAYGLTKTGMLTQTDACTEFGVEERDLRDYRDFVEGRSKLAEVEPIGTRRAYQGLLDHAYDVYCDTAAAYSFAVLINKESRLFGLNPRPVIELWEVSADAWPAHYKGIRQNK